MWLYIKVFLVGGAICGIGQLLILRTKLTAARILTGYVTAGVILGALGLYKPLVDFAAAGATVPLTGFGYALFNGAMEAVHEKGLLGAFTGGISQTAGGISAAILFGYLASVIFNPRMKE
jgi:stage V sporulation protein AE